MINKKSAIAILKLANDDDFKIFMQLISDRFQLSSDLLQTKIEPVDLYRLQGQCQFFKYILGLFEDAQQLVNQKG